MWFLEILASPMGRLNLNFNSFEMSLGFLPRPCSSLRDSEYRIAPTLMD